MYFSSCYKIAERFARAELPLQVARKDKTVATLASALYVYIVLGEKFVTVTQCTRLASMQILEKEDTVKRAFYRDCEKLGYSPKDLINKFISYNKGEIVK